VTRRRPSEKILIYLLLLVALTAFEAGAATSAVAGPSTAAKIFHWRPFLAPFHSVLLHYPIGFLTMAFILEIYGLRRGSPELRRITTFVIILSLVSGLVTASLGILRAGSGEYESKTLGLHRWLGMSIPILTSATLWLQIRAKRTEFNRVALAGYRAVLTTTLGVLVVAGHYGGNLTHGSKYLVENAPEFVKELFEEDAEPCATSQMICDESEKYFIENIQGIFNAKCVRCHGEEKQKAHYRLDQAEIAFKGGDSGIPAIKPNDPLHSNLVRLILLPPGHDDAMPPQGKQPLNPEEIMRIIHWIQNGAPFSRQVSGVIEVRIGQVTPPSGGTH
jgi:uncharacterized membrane protein